MIKDAVIQSIVSNESDVKQVNTIHLYIGYQMQNITLQKNFMIGYNLITSGIKKSI